jgi:magnesium transporter
MLVRQGDTRDVTEILSSLRTRVWRSGRLHEENFPLEQLSDYLAAEDCLVWVDLCDADHQHLQNLAQELGLHPAAVEDALAHGERAKATRYATHTFLTAYGTSLRRESPTLVGGSKALQVSRISAFVFPRGIMTVRSGDGFDIDEVVRRWDDNADLLRFGVGALVYGLLDVVVDTHFDVVTAMDDTVEGLEDGLFDDRAASREIQRRTFRVRKDLVELRRVVLPMRELVNAVLRHRKDFQAPSELDPWFDDLYDHVLRASEWTESLRDMISAIFETNLSLQDTRMNTVMKQLTAWAAIIAVPTAVTGFFGQNIPFPGFGQPLGVALSVTTIVGAAGLLYVLFKRRKWL